MKLTDKSNLAVILMLLGALLRFVYLGSMPGGLHQDEAFVAWNAFALWKDGIDSAGNVFPVYIADWGDGHSALYSYLLIPIYALVGEENITYFVTRLPQATIGTITLLVVYLLLKHMFGEKEGRWGLFLLAICPWHVMMCRWGLDANLAPAFLMFGLYFFIRGLDDNRWMIAAALSYGIGLYSYALVWPIVPVMLFLQIGYGVYWKKLSVNKWTIISVILLGIIAFPLLLFVINNSFGNGNAIRLGFMTIPVMNGYRADELAISFSGMWSNFRRVLTLLWRQNIGSPQDILLPHGLFYDIGRMFIIIGAPALVFNMIKKMHRKEFSYEVFIFIQLVGAGITCAIVYVYLHQVNSLYIPLVLCEAYGVWTVINWIKNKNHSLARLVTITLVTVYMMCLILFQKDYYGGYRSLTNSYFMANVKDAVEYAMEQGNEIMVERGAQWPRLLFYSRTTPKQYLSSVVYSNEPEPAHFSDGKHTFYINTDYENIDTEKIYIIYFPDKVKFEADFELKQFEEWYVAVPRD